MLLAHARLYNGLLQLSVSESAPFTLSLAFCLDDGIECCLEGTTGLLSDVPRLVTIMEKTLSALGAKSEVKAISHVTKFLHDRLAGRA